MDLFSGEEREEQFSGNDFLAGKLNVREACLGESEDMHSTPGEVREVLSDGAG